MENIWYKPLISVIITVLFELSSNEGIDSSLTTKRRKTKPTTKPSPNVGEDNIETHLTLAMVIFIIVLVAIIAISIAILVYFKVKNTEVSKGGKGSPDSKSKSRPRSKDTESATRISSIETIDSNTGAVIKENSTSRKN